MATPVAYTSQLPLIEAAASTTQRSVPVQVTPVNTVYETVAASRTAQVIGATGAAGDRILRIIVIPATTSPGNVLLLDNATSITVFTGGATSVADLAPFTIELNMVSVSGRGKSRLEPMFPSSPLAISPELQA